MRLSNENINETIEKLQKFFQNLKVSHTDEVKIRILLEEALLRYQEKFGEDYEFSFVTRKWFGTPKVIIRLKGTPYNPIVDYSSEQLIPENIMQNLLNYDSAEAAYRYENGYNEISVFSTKTAKKLKIPGGSTAISVLSAMVAALVVKQLPPDIQQIIVNDIATPVLNRLLGMIVAFSIPMIFISITASICSIENVAMLNNVGSKIFKRFLSIMVQIAIISIVVNALFFPVINFHFGGDASSDNLLEFLKIFDLLLNIIPQNIIAPFSEENVLQIVVLAFLLGVVITILGDRVTDLKNLVISSKRIIFEILDIVFKVTPLIISLCIFKTIMTGSFTEILKVWKIIVAEYILFVLISGIMFWRIKIKYGVKISEFLKKIRPVILIGLATGSGTAAMPKNLEVCKEDLKLDNNLCDFYIPLSNALCPTTMIVGIVTCVFFAAEFSNIPISISNLFILMFLAIQFGFFSSGVPSGTLTILGLLFTQMGLPLDSIGTILIADIFVINIASAVALIVRDCDLYEMSHEIKLSGG